MSGASVAPLERLERQVVAGRRLPFACEPAEGVGSHDRIVKARALQCALSRVCGICGEPLGRPLVFLGSSEEADALSFSFPPCHAACADEAVRDMGRLGDHLGRSGKPDTWEIVTTAGFDLVRPQRRGQPVSYHPNSVLDRVVVD